MNTHDIALTEGSKAKEILSLVDTLIASVNGAHHAKSNEWRDGCFHAADETYQKIKTELAAIEADRKRRGEPVAWPIAKEDDANKGWLMDYRFLEQVEKIASQRTNYTTSMEAAEQVLLAALEVLRTAPQPAEPVKVQP